MNQLSEEWTTCPYVKSHRVPRSRIQYHIVKCQKNKPILEICPFNATHRLPSDKIIEHCKNCPQKPVDNDNEDKSGLITVPKPMLQQEYINENDPDYECWDD